MDFGRRPKLGRSGSGGTQSGSPPGGQENKRPPYSTGADGGVRSLKRSSSLYSGSASTSPRSVLGPDPPLASGSGRGKRGFERQGSGAAYHEARNIIRGSNLGRNSNDQPGSARSRPEEPAVAAAGARSAISRTSSTVGKTEKRPKAAQQNPFVPLQSVWDNVYKWCGSWCGQASRDALSEDVDELNSKLDRLQAHCEKISAESALVKEQNDRLRENVRLLHSNGMARGSGNEIGRSSGNPRSSVVLPSPHDANDDLSIPRGRGPVRKGDLIGRGLALIIGGPKPR